MTRSVELAPGLSAAILASARAAFPRECCGLVAGVWNGEVARVLALYPARNLAPGADRFEIAPQDHIAAQKSARAKGHAIIGCYHSHPGGVAQPSAIDLARAGKGDFLWLIAGDTELNAFFYCEGKFLGCVTGADCVISSV